MPKDLGPEMFCSDDELVINWKGENYYKACGAPVRTMYEDAKTHCVKRTNHPTYLHEDYDGVMSHEGRPIPARNTAGVNKSSFKPLS